MLSHMLSFDALLFGHKRRTHCQQRLKASCPAHTLSPWLWAFVVGRWSELSVKSPDSVCYKTSTFLLACLHGVSKIVLALSDKWLIRHSLELLGPLPDCCHLPFDFTPLILSLACSWSTLHHWVNVSGILMCIWKQEEIPDGRVLLEELPLNVL